MVIVPGRQYQVMVSATSRPARTAGPASASSRALEILTERNAGDGLLTRAASLPEGRRYESLRDLLRALGLEPEERRGG